MEVGQYGPASNRHATALVFRVRLWPEPGLHRKAVSCSCKELTASMVAKGTVSRRVGYAHILKAPPAYSFGSKHDRPLGEGVPGPGTYDPDVLAAEFRRAGHGFGSSARDRLLDNGNPAPGAYQPAKYHLKSAPAYGFGSKDPGNTGHGKAPAPTAYEAGVSKDALKPSRPAISIGHRTQQHQAAATPGPDAYDPRVVGKEQPGVSLKFKHGPGLSVDPGPGPGQYDIHSAHDSSPGKSFGVSRGDPGLDNGVPGPIYTLEQGMHVVKPSRGGHTIGRSPRGQVRDNGVPGPGTYMAHAPVVDRQAGHSVKSQERSMPAYSIPGKPYMPRPYPSPGPSDYNPRDTLRKSAPAFSIHGCEQQDSRRKYPGPGHYKSEGPDAVRRSAPAISISHRHNAAGSRSTPGPGAYDPDFSSKEQPGISIKFRHPYGTIYATPAPHDYADKDFKRGTGCLCKKRGYTFGIRHKQFTQDAVPGPQYQVGCSTLGIAAQQRIEKQLLPLTVVL